MFICNVCARGAYYNLSSADYDHDGTYNHRYIYLHVHCV